MHTAVVLVAVASTCRAFSYANKAKTDNWRGFLLVQFVLLILVLRMQALLSGLFFIRWKEALLFL